MKIDWKNQKGFSLIEVIIAVALLAIIGVAYLGALGTAPEQ
jgi:prepilin-type N-terminal cleavage/methylation domain-containing protein